MSAYFNSISNFNAVRDIFDVIADTAAGFVFSLFVEGLMARINITRVPIKLNDIWNMIIAWRR